MCKVMVLSACSIQLRFWSIVDAYVHYIHCENDLSIFSSYRDINIFDYYRSSETEKRSHNMSREEMVGNLLAHSLLPVNMKVDLPNIHIASKFLCLILFGIICTHFM